MSCRLLPISQFPDQASAWDALNDAHFRHPLLESRFFSSALEELSSGSEKLLICGASGMPDAIAIVGKDRLGACSTFQPSQSPLGSMIRSPGADTATLATQMLAGLPLSCQILALTQQDPDLIARPHDDPKLRTLDYIDTARITIDGSFDDYWASRGKNLRHNMKRQRNRLEREGVPVRVEMLDKPEQMADGVRRYGELESQGWKAQGGTAIHPDNAQGRFYSSLLTAYAETGNARIYECYYGDKLSAVDLCVFNESAMVILKTTYDETIQTSSPALLMRREYFPRLFDQREVGRIEFYGKVMDWHTKWSDEIRRMYHVNAYRGRMMARLHGRGA